MIIVLKLWVIAFSNKLFDSGVNKMENILNNFMNVLIFMHKKYKKNQFFTSLSRKLMVTTAAV